MDTVTNLLLTLERTGIPVSMEIVIGHGHVFKGEQLESILNFMDVIEWMGKMPRDEVNYFAVLRQYYGNDVVLFSWMQQNPGLKKDSEVMQTVYGLHQAVIEAGMTISLCMEGRALVIIQQQLIISTYTVHDRAASNE